MWGTVGGRVKGVVFGKVVENVGFLLFLLEK